MRFALRYLFDLEHILTPIAFERLRVPDGHGFRSIRLLYVFGVRVAYWNMSR
jgi:hypothetical protein